MSDSALTWHEVLGGSPRDLDDLLSIHRELFPQYTYYQPYMRQRAQRSPDADPRFVEHWWLFRVNGEAAGVRFFKYVPARRCGIALAIGILPHYRALHFDARRFSEAALYYSRDQIQDDARRAGQPVPYGLVTEIEYYLLRRYFGSYGFLRLPIDYLEPSFTDESRDSLDPVQQEHMEFRPIQLGVFPCPDGNFDPTNPDMLKDIVLALLIDHYGMPGTHPIVKRALDSITSMPQARDS